jgi:putative acetyltransferase
MTMSSQSAAIVVRRFGARDTLATWNVFYAAVRETAVADYSPEQVVAWAPDSINLTEWRRRRLGSHTFVAVENEVVVGFVDVTDEGLLDMLFVHPDWGCRGAARLLVQRVIAQAEDLGLSRVHTHASRTARPVFERLGFVVDRVNEQNWIRGQNLPNYDMHLDLI